MKLEICSVLLLSLFYGIFCGRDNSSEECIPAVQSKYKGCSNQVGNYVLEILKKQCSDKWATAELFKKFEVCKTMKDLNLTAAIEDCGPEITKQDNADVHSAVCPKPPVDSASEFLQYHMMCCLVNHALEFSEKTWDESVQVDKECLSE